MRIKSFRVQGFANLTGPVELTPLQDVNLIYGPSNAGKSNLLRAQELYFRLLGAAETVTKMQAYTFDRPDDALNTLAAESFNETDPQPITFIVEWSIAEKDLEGAGLFPEMPCSTITTDFELRSVNRNLELKTRRWLMEANDLAQLDRMKDAAQVGFGQQVRRFLSDARPFKAERPFLPYGLLPDSGELFPQDLRNALFDARQSMSADARKRWTLFAELAAALRPELGVGQWETTFDRSTGRADLVYAREGEMLTLPRMGAGVQRYAAMVARLALCQDLWVCVEEPESRMHPDLQRRFVNAARKVIQSGTGPRQLFITTQSPALTALGQAFSLQPVDGVPVAEQKAWDLAGAAPAAGADPDAGLGQLIGLVETLADLDPDALVPEAATAAPPRPAATAPPGTPPFNPRPNPTPTPAGAAPGGTTPPWRRG